MKVTMGVKVDMRALQKIEQAAPGGADRILGKLAFDGERYTKENFSTTSPSAAGDPPGIVTGNLKNSIKAEQTGHLQWQIAAGTEYAVYLEYGTVRMLPRPFMHPMKFWLEQRVVGAFKEFWKA